MAILRVVKNLGYVKPRPQSTKVREEIADVKLHIAGPGDSYLVQKKERIFLHKFVSLFTFGAKVISIFELFLLPLENPPRYRVSVVQ